jgi:F-type H+-transporting ATPase subunit b
MLKLDWTLLAAGTVFLVTLWALNVLLFRPLWRVLDERRARGADTRADAARKLDYERALSEECEARLKGEKQKGYQLSEAVRREAVEARQVRLAQAREHAEARLTEAREMVRLEVESARVELKRSAEEMARIIADRILERA